LGPRNHVLVIVSKLVNTQVSEFYRARLSSRTSNALNALVLSEQVRFKQTSETVCTDGRVQDEIREREFQSPDCEASN